MTLTLERVVPARVVRRIIRRHRAVGGFGHEVPHDGGYALPTSELTPAERTLLTIDAPQPALVLLIARGEDLPRRRLELTTFAAWEAYQQGGGDLAPLHALLDAAERDEVRTVLRARRRLLPPRPNEPPENIVWSLFAAYWAELRTFEPELLPIDLPSLARRRDAIDRGLAALVPWSIPADPTPLTAPAAPTSPHPDLASLGTRLDAALGLSLPWADVLAPLADHPDRRLRQDLAKVAHDHERTPEQISLTGLFTRPRRQPLPLLARARIVRHLARAEARIPLLDLTPSDRARLTDVLARAHEHAAATLRNDLRAAVHDATAPALDRTTVVEARAHDKLVEELLDRVLATGRLDFATLRDAVARNGSKLNDLGRGRILADPLLVADRALASQLAGVHRRAESYRRGLHRLSALLFGTALGRRLTLFLLIPLLGAYALLELLQHTLVLLVEGLADRPLTIVTPLAFAATALVLWGLVNAPPFRRVTLAGLRGLGRGLRATFVAFPRWLAARPWVRAVRAWLASRLWRGVWSWLLLPTLVALPLAIPIALGALGDLPPPTRALLIAGLVLVLSLVGHTPLGWRLGEAATDAWVGTRRAITQHFGPALVAWVVAFFRGLMDGLERAIYAVDERLRTRAGDRRRRVVLVALLSLPWRALSYLVRLYVNVSLEPKVNPVKHFPAVTIGHKLVIPLSLALDQALEGPLGPSAAHVLAAALLFVLPGLFGFLAWESKENWRLYAANRPLLLTASVIGSHGETMVRLLRPGLHSGTLPKLFAKWRRVARRAPPLRVHPALSWAARLSTWRLQVLAERHAHLVTDLRHFIERELIALITHTGGTLQLGEVELATNRVRIHLQTPQPNAPTRAWRLTFELRDGVVLGTLEPALDPAHDPPTFVTAMRGVPALAGLDAAHTAPLTWAAWVDSWAESGRTIGRCP